MAQQTGDWEGHFITLPKGHSCSPCKLMLSQLIQLYYKESCVVYVSFQGYLRTDILWNNPLSSQA